MKELVVEILLRLIKPIAATIVGFAVYFVGVAGGGLAQGAETALLCWLVGAAFVLLVESGPI